MTGRPDVVVPDRLRHAARMLPLRTFHLSTTVLVVGLAWFVVAPAAARPVLNVGLFLLMAVPFLRVSVLLAIYAYRRDTWSLAATVVVLAIVVTTLVTAWLR
ncbi:MAG: DUF1634 domain-containing protein [Vicinamibacterales bacterium]